MSALPRSEDRIWGEPIVVICSEPPDAGVHSGRLASGCGAQWYPTR